MHKDLLEANWKKTGTKHVPLGKKSGISEALRAYAAAHKDARSLDGVKAFKDAHAALLAAVSKAKNAFPKAKNAKLHVELDKVEDAADAEKKDHNNWANAITFKEARSDFRDEITEQADAWGVGNEWSFIRESNSGPDNLYNTYVAPNAPKLVAVDQKLIDKCRAVVKKEGKPFVDDLVPIYKALETQLEDKIVVKKLRPALKV